MGEQFRGENWLPEGWKIEIRVRKSGKKDRYYTDPVNGYIFRSLKDIDRYLLSGKLGKHVTKNRPKSLGSEDEKIDFVQQTDVLENIQSVNSKEEKKLCPSPFEAQKRTRNEASEDKTRAEDSKKMVKKPSSKSSKGSKTPRHKKKRESTPFFILDPDQCGDSSSLSIPNLTEIVDIMLREKEDSKNVYLSAPAIGSLLGQSLLETRTTNYSLKKHKLGPNMSKDYGISSNMLPCMPSELVVKKEDWESRSLAVPYHLQPRAPTKGSRMMIAESKAEVSGCLDFGDLFDDPCIDFSIKTLTGNLSLGA